MPDSHNPLERKYVIGRPAVYSVLPLPSAEQRPPLEKKALVEIRPRRRRAVWIVHGMGQQLPFETLDSLAEGIMRVARPPAGLPDFTPRVRTVQIGEQTIQRVEIDVSWQGRDTELHLYESYWAPVPEGKIKLSDVIGFLFDASFRGLLNAVKNFKRAMFGEMVDFKINRRTALEVSVTLLTLAALVALNAVITAAGASAYGLTGHKFPNIATNWVALSAVASCLSTVAIAFGLILFLAELTRPSQISSGMRSLFSAAPILLETFVKWSKRLICYTTWMAFVGTLAAVLAGAASLCILAAYSGPRLSPTDPLFPQLQALSTLIVLAAAVLSVVVVALRGLYRSAGQNLLLLGYFFPFFISSLSLFSLAFFGPVFIAGGQIQFSALYSLLPRWLSSPFWVWPLLFLFSYLVRQLMVEYVGDVAAYITPNKLDRFNKIRQKIKKIALDSASAVYLAHENGEFVYDKVAVVGHSLGSVIAYDTLNALLNAEALSLTDLKIAERTCLFETFGSPLDKIAFFFTIQGNEAFHIREQLAAAVQPLISDYGRFRPFRWINIYSRNDIVSGKVELYDLPPKGRPPAVRRLIRHHRVRHFSDSDAIVPLVAHVDYWKNTLVWRMLVSRVTR
jgi:hypothetical protein